ncbi:hypothetical protein FRB95_005940 [Tulasnella sp. JGI-2019a]|nr:hypothetical protein FRB95_005940 [Tulasnella sp. JGI-2019a]
MLTQQSSSYPSSSPLLSHSPPLGAGSNNSDASLNPNLHQFSSQHQQQPPPPSASTTHQHFSAYQPPPPQQQQQHQQLFNQYDQRSVTSSYLDNISLSDNNSPSLSVLSPHSEPFNPESSSHALHHHKSNAHLHLNGAGASDNDLYRANANSTSFTGAIRPPQQQQQRPSQQSGLYEDVHSQYLTQDLYATSQPQQSQQQFSMPPLHENSRQHTFDLDNIANKQSQGGGYGNLLRNGSLQSANGPYGTGSSLPESQQVAVNKAIQQQVQQLVQQQVQQQQQQQLHQQQQFASQQQLQAQAIINSLPPNISSRDYILALQQVQQVQNSGQQTANNVVVSSLPGGPTALNLTNLTNGSGNAASVPSQEEISTIFVVGFPDDMQEREFQNMFTFCQGFEAATLKVPHKELSSFGASGNASAGQTERAQAAAAAAATLRSAGFLPPGQPNAFGVNGVVNSADPYNILSNLGDGAGLWNGLGGVGAAVDDPFNRAVLNLAPGGPHAADGNSLSLANASTLPPPRRQIIGFAKFRTRQEALDAREVLQGRRVDMEKGSMLKAEMAKKNLHTKRGVGPSGGGASAASGGNTATQQNAAAVAGGQGVGGAAGGPPVLNAETLAAGLAAVGFTAQQIREFNGLAGLGLATAAQQQQQVHHQQQQASAALGGEMFSPRDRDREMSALGAMGLNGIGIGMPSTVREQRERENQRDMLEREPRTRQNTLPLNAYDAFHSVPASHPPRPVTFTNLPNMGASTRVVSGLPPPPINGNGVIGGGTSASGFDGGAGSTTPRHNSGGNTAFNPIDPIVPPASSAQQQQSSGLSPINGAGETRGRGASGGGSLWPTNSFRDPAVDPLDTSGAMPSGPSSVVGGPTLSAAPSSALYPAGVSSASSAHTLSRQPSSLFQHSSPEQDTLTLTPFSGNLNVNDQPQSSSQHSPASVQGLASQVVSPPMSQQSQASSFGGMNGMAMSDGVTNSSVGSAGSSSPPEKYQQNSLFDSFPGSGGANNGQNGYETDLTRHMAGLGVSSNAMLGSGGTHQELTSPQLPSPGSGGSGSGRPNAADQNPPQINTLYVGNLPSTNAAHPNTLEEGLRALFSRCSGYRKLCFRQKSNGPMCFVEFDDIPSATKSLNELYGNTLNGLVKGGIRLSFSKNPLGVRAGSVSSNGGSLGGGANLFSAALAGITDTRFSNTHGHLMQQRHASLSGLPTFGADVPLPRANRQESVDVLSPSAFSSFGFGAAQANHLQQHRSFSPSSYLQQPQSQSQQQAGQTPMQLGSSRPGVPLHSSTSFQQPQQSSAFSQHHSSSLIDGGLNHQSLNLLGNINNNPTNNSNPNSNLNSYADPRDQHYHQSDFSTTLNTNLPSSSSNANNIGLSSSPQPGVEA